MTVRTSLVLIVDDDTALLSLMRTLIESQGYRVLTASSGALGLETMFTPGNDIDLVLTDISMPDGTGIDLVKQVKARRPDTPIVFMSGYVYGSELRRSLHDATVQFLRKPFSPTDLFTAIERALAPSP